MSTTAFRDDDVGASLRADELEAKLARVVVALEARVGQPEEPKGLQALLPMGLIGALLFALESPDKRLWLDAVDQPIMDGDPLWASLGKLPFPFAVALGVTAVLSALPILVLITPSQLLPRRRAAQLKRRFAPPPRGMRPAERVQALELTLAEAREALKAWGRA